jgi:uncharacterized protein (TIGR03083 family)
MELSPRYGGTPVLSFDPPPVDPSVPLLRQRRRLAATLGRLDDDQWMARSRCAGWSCRDVVVHLCTVNAFWAASVEAGRRGEPTRYLHGFDPAVTPATLVAASPALDAEELLEAYVGSTEALATALDGLDTAGWTRPGESPTGHVAISTLALHALWDGWIHERDITLPLGLAPDEEPDEVAWALRFAVGIGPAMLAVTGSTRTGTFAVVALDPDLELVVEISPGVVVRGGTADGATVVRGGAVPLLEAFSRRTGVPPFPGPDRWMVDALAVVFDQVP